MPLTLAAIQSSAPASTWSNAAVTPGNSVGIQPVDVHELIGIDVDVDGQVLSASSLEATQAAFSVFQGRRWEPRQRHVDTAERSCRASRT